MPNTLKEQGFAHLLAVLAAGVFTLLFVSSVIPVTRQYNDGKSSVAGVYLAKGGDSGSSGSTQTTTTKLESKSKSNEIKKEIEKREVETKEVKDNQRVEVKTTPEKIKSEIRQGNLRIKFELENGQVVETNQSLLGRILNRIAP